MMTRKIIVIDKEKCIQCGGCCAVCPRRALSLVGGNVVEWDENKCVGCGLCVKVCPANAIKIIEVDEDEDKE
jgi:NAD-dependent dihydropyrimidine dehydrogenase PreA subunit